MERLSRGLLLPLLLAALAGAQYEKYSFRGFPAAELLQHAYALEQYEGKGWKESVRALEASLCLHRLLCDSEADCHQECAGGGSEALGEPWLREPAFGEPGAVPDEGLAELELFGRILWRAFCLQRCKSGLPVFQLRYLPAETLHDFQRRTPYLYLYYMLYKYEV